MSFFPDMACATMIVSGKHIPAVGWLRPPPGPSLSEG